MPFETVAGDSVSWGIRKPGGPVGYQSVIPYTSKNILEASIAEPLCFFFCKLPTEVKRSTWFWLDDW
jgi:hypothetical protein